MQGSGKERYVFLSFPHISVDAMGTVGAISRPGRPGQSCACGALNAALADIKATGLKANCKRPGGEGSSAHDCFHLISPSDAYKAGQPASPCEAMKAD